MKRFPLAPRAAPPVLRLQHTLAPICSGARSGLALRCSFHLRNSRVDALASERAAYAGDAPRAMRRLLYRFSVGRRFPDGDWRGSASIVVIVIARPMVLRPVVETAIRR